MTTLAPATGTMHAETRPAFSARVVNAVSNFLRAWKNRRAFYELSAMSDAELSDIGLTRGDLNVAVALPFGSDPTVHLGTLADARLRPIDDAARLTS